MTAPVATLVVGLIGIAGVLLGMGQRTWSEGRDRAHRIEHDVRTEWWRRYQWAAEQANQGESLRAQEFGKAVMSALTDEGSVTASELAIIAAVATRLAMLDNETKATGDAA